MDRRVVLLAVMLALFLAPLVAAGVAPDPTWIPGLYDDSDADTLAILWENTAAVVPAVTALLPPSLRVLGGLRAACSVVSRSLPRPSSRAPPQV